MLRRACARPAAAVCGVRLIAANRAQPMPRRRPLPAAPAVAVTQMGDRSTVPCKEPRTQEYILRFDLYAATDIPVGAWPWRRGERWRVWLEWWGRRWVVTMLAVDVVVARGADG